MHWLRNYVTSFYTYLGFFSGAVMYVSYALPTGRWASPSVLTVGLFVAVFLPYFSALSNYFDDLLFRITASLFCGKLARLTWQYAFNLFALGVLMAGGVITPTSIAGIGGIFWAVLLMSAASQGLQYVMLVLANRHIGNRLLNIILSMVITIVIGALASLGFPIVQVIFVVFGIVFGAIGLLWAVVTDLAGVFAPKGGIGVFFGTFNPVHDDHLRILKSFIKERRLEKVYVHSTLVPKFYRGELHDGKIRITSYADGMRHYSPVTTNTHGVDLLPNGIEFYEQENRLAMLRAALADEGLAGIVDVLYRPDLYDEGGFAAIVDLVRSRHPGAHLHGLHGTDRGGAVVRLVLDEKRVWPFAVRRNKNSISATAIRHGRSDATTPTVRRIRALLRDDSPKHDGQRFELAGWTYEYHSGRHTLIETSPTTEPSQGTSHDNDHKQTPSPVNAER